MPPTFWRVKVMKRLAVIGVVMLALLWGTGAVPGEIDREHVYTRVNLVSDIAGVARVTDPNLVNPWGLAFSPTGPFWLGDNGRGVSDLLDGRGQPVPLVVTVPSVAPSGSTPTATVFNGGTGFAVWRNGVSAPSRFLFATENGTI